MSGLADALRGRLDGWAGLPALTAPELEQAAGGRGAFRERDEERVGTRYRVLDIAAPELARTVSAWFRGDEADALWVELDEPAAFDVAPLGEPPHRFESRRPVSGGTAVEQVWPERGAGVAIAGNRVAWAALFRPMPFEDYLTSAGRPPALRPYTF